jgi:nitrate/nitrite-specific signal transduction histidine kinase
VRTPHFSSLWRNTLRNRIITWSFIPSLIILLAVAVVTFYAYERVAEDLVVQRNRELARLSAAQLTTALSEFSNALSVEARKAAVYRGGYTEQRAALADARNRLAVFDAGVVFLDAHGLFITSEPERTEELGRDWSTRVFFRDLLRSNRPVFSDISDAGAGSSRVVVVAVPVTGEQGEFVGVLAGMFQVGATSVSSLYGDIVKLRIGETGNVFLVDGGGLLIYHQDIARAGTSLAGDPIVEKALGGQVGAVRTRDLNGLEVVAGFAPVPGTSWGLITNESWAAVTSSGQGYRRFLLLLLALGAVVPAVVVWFGVKRITRPIAELTGAAKEVAEGNFCSVVASQKGEEIEELAEQFNRMSSRLQDSYALLEQRVTDRTRELNALANIAAVVSETLNVDHILEDSLTELLEISTMDFGVAYRVDAEDKNRLNLVTYQGIPEQWAETVSTQGLDDWLDPSVMDKPAAWREGSFPTGGAADMLHASGIRLVVTVPLTAKGRLLGAIALGAPADRDVTPEELSLLSSAGQQVGMALDNARLYERAERSAAAAERSRLARDLHDAVSQTLFSSALIADVLPRIWETNPQEGRKRLEELRQLTRGALAEMRTLLLELRPSALEQGELGDLLRQLSEAITGRARVPVVVSAAGQVELPPEVQVAFYRIAQEALNNVAKHAGAAGATVELRTDGRTVELVVSDDGRGFEPDDISPEHLGVGIMRERALAIGAELTVDSKPGRGTRIAATWCRDTAASDGAVAGTRGA